MFRKTLIAGMAIIAIPSLSPASFAEDAVPVPTLLAEAPQEIAVLVPDTNLISDEDLLALRGGTAIVVGNQTLTAINNGSVFNGDYRAGNIALTDNALSNFNGLGNLVINTGAQNNLQSAMNVTINFAQ